MDAESCVDVKDKKTVDGTVQENEKERRGDEDGGQVTLHAVVPGCVQHITHYRQWRRLVTKLPKTIEEAIDDIQNLILSTNNNEDYLLFSG